MLEVATVVDARSRILLGLLVSGAVKADEPIESVRIKIDRLLPAVKPNVVTGASVKKQRETASRNETSS